MKKLFVGVEAFAGGGGGVGCVKVKADVFNLNLDEKYSSY
jgi:hypothetical protein